MADYRQPTAGRYAETIEVVVFSGAYWLAWLSLAAKVKAGSGVRGKRADWKGYLFFYYYLF